MMAQRGLSFLAILMVTALIGGCVTTVESRLTRKANPDKAVENYTQLGMGYMQQGRYDRARTRLNRALELNSDYAPAHSAMGLLLQLEGEAELAKESFETSLDLDSEYSQGHYSYGLFLMQNKDFEPACDHLKQAAQDIEFQQRGKAYTSLGLCYFRQGDSKKAIETFKRTLKVQRYNAEALVNLTALLFEETRFKEAQTYYDRFTRLVERKQSKHTSHSLWLGIKLAEVNGNSKQVVALASELVKTFPGSEEYKLYKESL